MGLRRPATVDPVSTGAATAEVDPVACIAELAEPLEERRSVRAWATESAGQLVRTPRRAALTTAWAFLFAIAVACLVPTSRSVQSTLGPAHVRCGLDAFLYGSRDAAVTHACRSAEGVRFAFFVPATAFVVLGAVGAIIAIGGQSDRGRQWLDRGLAWIRRFPVQSAAMFAGVLAIPVLVWSLRPASTMFVRSGHVTTLRCGADSYFFGFPDRHVNRACSAAYASRGHLLIGATVVIVLALVASAHAAVVAATGTSGRVRIGLACIAVVLAFAGALALKPVAVEIRRPHTSPLVVNCGVDSYVAGYPDPSVQSTCRSRFAGHAGAAALAGSALLFVIGTLAVTSRTSTACQDRPVARGSSS